MNRPSTARQARGAFVSWVSFHGRSQGFINQLGLTPIYVSYLRTSDLISAPLKYGPQFFRTLTALAKAQPQVVFVMDPPMFAVAAVFMYCVRRRARYVMDCHSGVFEVWKWRWSLPLQRFFAKRAAAVIVTNPRHAAIVRSWGARCLTVADPPEPVPRSARAAGSSTADPYVFIIAAWGSDEAVPEIFAAAAQLPSVNFKISGNPSRTAARWLRDCPPNVTLTGYLPLERFWNTLQDALVILTLTSLANTILRGGWEAMFASKPLVTSDTGALRDYFTGGTVFVANTPDGIAAGIRQALEHHGELSEAMDRLRREKALLWEGQRQQLEQLLIIDIPR